MSEQKVKWGEVWSLAGLNAAIVISWIAYHEYQPTLVEAFGLQDLGFFLVVVKAIVLVLIPPFAGKVSDYFIAKNNGLFIVMLSGISVTAMVFMAVASMVQLGPGSALASALPMMIVFWLIGMNIFHGPANSLIKWFSPNQQLPLIVGVLVLVNELLYALEPVIVYLIDSLFGPVLTFVVGGILISVTGYIFHRVSKNEVQMVSQSVEDTVARSNFIKVGMVGLILGLIHGFVVEVIPNILSFNSIFQGLDGAFTASTIIAIAAILAIPCSRFIIKSGLSKSLWYGVILAAIGGLFVMLFSMAYVQLLGCILLAFGLSLVAVSSFPLAINNLTNRQITLGTGIYFGFTALAGGVFEIIFA